MNAVEFVQNSSLVPADKISFLKIVRPMFDEDGSLNARFCVQSVDEKFDTPVLLGVRGVSFLNANDAVKDALNDFFPTFSITEEQMDMFGLPAKWDGVQGVYTPTAFDADNPDSAHDVESELDGDSGGKILKPACFKAVDIAPKAFLKREYKPASSTDTASMDALLAELEAAGL